MASKRICLCGEEFEAKTTTQKFCTVWHKKICMTCGETFQQDRRKLKAGVELCASCSKTAGAVKQGQTLSIKMSGSKTLGFGNPQTQELAKAGVFEKFGVENVSQVAEVRQKVEITSQERFGGKSPFASEAVQAKIRETNLERLGVENPFASSIVQEAIKVRLEETYGVSNPTLVPEFREKQLASMLQNHGVKQPLQSSAILAKQQKTLFEKYGVTNSSQLEEVRTRSRERLLLMTDDNFIALVNELSSLSTSKKTTPEQIRLLSGYESIAPVYKRLKSLKLTEFVQYGSESLVNKKWHQTLLRELGISFQTEGAIFSNKRWKCDLFDENSKVAIDINPTISHSTQQAHPFYTPKTVKYHQSRALDAEANGWTLYQIYDWSDEPAAISQIRNLLKLNESRIFARQCSIVKPTKEEAIAFLNANHRQKSASVGSYIYGLEHKGELVQVMTFAKSRFRGAQAEFELIRLASLGTVVGGASRLFKTFIREVEPNSIQTFASLDTSHGRIYETLGFRFSRLAGLNALYSRPGSTEAIKVTTCSTRFRKEYETQGLTQQEFMNSLGFFRINDAGNKIFIWERKEIKL